MSFFQSSTVQVEDASLTKIPFRKKNGVPDTVPENTQNNGDFRLDYEIEYEYDFLILGRVLKSIYFLEPYSLLVNSMEVWGLRKRHSFEVRKS